MYNQTPGKLEAIDDNGATDDNETTSGNDPTDHNETTSKYDGNWLGISNILILYSNISILLILTKLHL